MKHDPIVSPRIHPLACSCGDCRPRMPFVDRALAWALATALLIAFASLIHS